MGVVADLKDVLTSVLTLTKDMAQSKGDIKELRADIHKLTLAVQQLSNEIHRIDEREESERHIIKLELENSLLKQKSLPKQNRAEPKKFSKKPKPTGE